ncbi:MAG TPA: hypothetical protein DEO88_05760 [Syntrophobacteraceae bacterium]|jgi:ABC-type nitrate/sulfonate/bicarbonate transport system substrate-binding protein|nr:hypothetical protein [Syntrophobacteraceae bacterium]
MLEAHGASRLLVTFNDAIPGYVFGGIFFSNEFINRHPEQVKAFLRGLVNAFEFIRKDEAKARETIPKYAHVERDVAMKSAIRQFEDGREPKAQLSKQMELMVRYGFLSEPVPIEKVVDYSYLPK